MRNLYYCALYYATLASTRKWKTRRSVKVLTFGIVMNKCHLGHPALLLQNNITLTRVKIPIEFCCSLHYHFVSHWNSVAIRLPPSAFHELIRVTVGPRGGVVVKALRYNPAGRGFHSRWCQWNFSVT
jgi:hypothetical protein